MYGETGKGTHQCFEFGLHGDTGYGDGFRAGIITLAICLDGRQHHERAVAGQDIGNEPVVCI